MAIQTTANLTSAVRTRYLAKYLEAAQLVRLYDQLSTPVGAAQLELERARGMGTTYTFNFLSDMTPASAAISETADITPQNLVDSTATVTPTSRAEALQWSEGLELQAYTNYGEQRFKVLGKNHMESIDELAKVAALQGTLVLRGAARASLDAGTSANRLTDAALWKASSMLTTLKCPPFIVNGQAKGMAIMHPDVFYDLISAGNVVSIALYQDKEIWFRGELGQLANMKLIVSPWAKVFGAAGADNAANIATTVATTDAKALDKSITIAVNTNTTSGLYITIGTEETANTWYPTNDIVRGTLASISTTLTFVGEGANGGLRFPHLIGEAVRNADNVYPVAYGTPGSLCKVYAQETGEFGEVVGPKKDGIVDQFATIGWKFYGGYGRISESYILRGEYSSSLQA